MKKRLKNFPIGLLIFIGIICLFLYGISETSSQSVARQKTALENATERNIISCYALEGFYPPSLAYMEEHYGLTYDSSLFLIDYRPIGANIYPDFTIIEKGDLP